MVKILVDVLMETMEMVREEKEVAENALIDAEEDIRNMLKENQQLKTNVDILVKRIEMVRENKNKLEVEYRQSKEKGGKVKRVEDSNGKDSRREKKDSDSSLGSDVYLTDEGEQEDDPTRNQVTQKKKTVTREKSILRSKLDQLKETIGMIRTEKQKVQNQFVNASESMKKFNDENKWIKSNIDALMGEMETLRDEKEKTFCEEKRKIMAILEGQKKSCS